EYGKIYGSSSSHAQHNAPTESSPSTSSSNQLPSQPLVQPSLQQLLEKKKLWDINDSRAKKYHYHKLFWACFEESSIEQPTEEQPKNATAEEIAHYIALAKADRKINPYEWWALSINKNRFPILSKLELI
ncbi:hypothetical protein QE152_g14222, partial [Popillia japonica]